MVVGSVSPGTVPGDDPNISAAPVLVMIGQGGRGPASIVIGVLVSAIPVAPQHFTVPSSRSAHVCRLPAASALTPQRFETGRGRPLAGRQLTPTPSCPYRLSPQHRTVPFVK